MTSESPSIEQRLQRLEDIEDIKMLKARYCDRCDDGYDADGIAGLMTDDAVWDGGTSFAVVRGREEIRAHFQRAAGRVTMARHQVMNPVIEVDGDTATGQWLLFQPCTDASIDGAAWLAATYRDEYRRVDGQWLISHTGIDVAFFTPYEEGWANQQFLPGRTLEPS